MSYFAEGYNLLRYPTESPQERGFRTSQLGAIHSIAAHFTLHSDPAVVVMPTGSGKTAVLMTAAFVLKSHRVLVVTPSRLVRNQMANEWKGLKILKELRAVPEDMTPPSVVEVTSQVSSAQAWQDLADANVIIGTPRSVSPAIAGVAQPPEDFFDLILIDEAHHAPAKTWNAVAAAFPGARRALFTATPFRQDQREIVGRFVYVYPVARAFEEGVFGRVEYVPVHDRHDVDKAIAQHAQREVRNDRARGLQHYLFVRTDSKKRADQLSSVYAESTSLKLKVIHSGYSLTFIKRTVGDLRNGALDGIICVDMLGEGFDLPNLKIAAIHKPHKSLAVTLQFIGRFARTNAPDIGGAKFIAAPADIRIEAQKLFREGAVWQDIIMGLGDDRVRREVSLREQIDSFTRTHNIGDVTEDLSLYSLRPFHHVKILRTEGQVDLRTTVDLADRYEVIHREISERLGVSIFITRERRLPRWSRSEQFARVEYDLFIVYWDRASELLFICASRRLEPLYDEIADQFAPEGTRRLPTNVLNRVLRPFEGLRFYNVGMRHRASNTESYRIMTGTAADRAIRPSDGRLFHQGHAFGGVSGEDGEGTIGLSSASKVWSNRHSQIPDIVAWCQEIAKELMSEQEFRTFSGLDHIPVGRETDLFPGIPIAAGWDRHTNLNPPVLEIILPTGEIVERDLLSCDLTVTAAEAGATVVELLIVTDDQDPVGVSLGPSTPPYLTRGAVEVHVVDGDQTWSLAQYLLAYPPFVYQADFSCVHGSELLPAPPNASIMLENVEARDWAEQGVDIKKEFGASTDVGESIHAFLERTLGDDGSQVVFYDHGSGEVADFVTARQAADGVTFRFYHCKSAGGSQPGRRVADAYEVCGQVVKTAAFIEHAERLYSHVARRFRSRSGSRFVAGDLEELRRVVDAARTVRSAYEVVLVQPGIAASRMTEAIRDNLAAAGDYVRSANGSVRIWISE